MISMSYVSTIIIVHQLTLNLTRWQHIVPLISDHTYRNVLIRLGFICLIVAGDGLSSQLLRD